VSVLFWMDDFKLAPWLEIWLADQTGVLSLA
jgi:hypothetical protein